MKQQFPKDEDDKLHLWVIPTKGSHGCDHGFYVTSLTSALFHVPLLRMLKSSDKSTGQRLFKLKKKPPVHWVQNKAQSFGFQVHRITELSGLEGTSGDLPVHPPSNFHSFWETARYMPRALGNSVTQRKIRETLLKCWPDKIHRDNSCLPLRGRLLRKQQTFSSSASFRQGSLKHRWCVTA